MSLIYHIYSNGGTGGAVDDSTPLASVTGLNYVSAPLAPGSDTTFAVRVLDPATNLEEANTDARVRIVLDAGGHDVTNVPNPPHSLTATPTANGGCRLAWAYSPAGQGGMPTGFFVYLSPGSAVNYTNQVASVPYVSGQTGFSCELNGLADGAVYSIGVRSSNAVATEANVTVVATVTGDTTPPDDVDALSATVI